MIRCTPWTLATLLVACGGTPRPSPVGNQASVQTVDDGPAPLPAPGRFYTPGLQDYAAVLGLPPDPLEAQLRQVIQRSVEPPEALDCLAREYAGRFAADGKDPGTGAVQAMADRCGYWSRPDHVYAATAKSESALVEHTRKIPLDAVPGAVGIGVARHPDGRATAAILVPPGEFRMDPVPRQPKAGVLIQGRLLRGDGALEVWVDDGTPRQVDVTADAAGRFRVALPPLAPDSALKVEIVRHTSRFRRTMGLITLGVPRQDGYAKSAGAIEPMPDAAKVVALANAARKDHGLPPLKAHATLHSRLDDWLGRIASGEKTSEPPGIGDERGWPFARTRYGFTSGSAPHQAVDLLLDTPTGRDLLLDPKLDGIAVGRRAFARGGGFDAVILGVERFKSQPSAAVRAKVLEEVIITRGLPIAEAPALQKLAQTLADDALAGRVIWKEAVPTIMLRVKATRPVKGGFGAGAFTVVDAENIKAKAMPHALDPKMNHIGIGVASGPLPGGGIPRFIIVYIAAEALRPDG